MMSKELSVELSYLFTGLVIEITLNFMQKV